MMLKKYILRNIAVLLLILPLSGYTYYKASIDPEKIGVTWTMIKNNYQGKEESLSSIKLINRSNAELPSSGWKIYFNFGHTITPLSSENKLNVSHVNGGLYYISPVDGFKGLKAGADLVLECLSKSWFVNFTEAPHGFYLVWDQNPSVAYEMNDVATVPPTNSDMLKRINSDKIPSLEDYYRLNERLKKPETGLCLIFPTPLAYEEQTGFFKLTQNTTLYFDARFKKEADLLKETFNLNAVKPLTQQQINQGKGIIMRYKKELVEQAYELQVNQTSIVITAGSNVGMFYGLQSLKMLVSPATKGNLTASAKLVKCVTVKDQPTFGFRSLMLDVARNFHTVKQVKKMIDLLALYKLNTLHLHLNDDEGWRLEISALPELTSVGSKRGHTIGLQSLPPAYGSGSKVNASAGSGYYSRADYVDILKYATARHIQVIPEIETPGHARAAIVSMAARHEHYLKLGDTAVAQAFLLQSPNDKSQYRTVQKWNDNVIDVALPSVYNFLTVVTDEVISMYKEAKAPLPSIHFGGDETPAGVWEKSDAVNKLKAENKSIKTTQDLWDYFFGNINTMLKKRGLYLSGWEETALIKTTGEGSKKWIPNPLFAQENFHVNVWNNMMGNEDLAYRIANAGYKVILSCVTNFYFDMAYSQDFMEPGFNWGGLIDLEKPFKFIPFDYLSNESTDYLRRPLKKEVLSERERLKPEAQKNIIGIQAMLWAETVKTSERMEYMLLPRLLALSERAWGASPKWATEKDTLKASELYQKDWVQFVYRTANELKRLDNYAVSYNYRIPSPGLIIKDGNVYANSELPGFDIRYTTDGTEPTAKSKLYTKALNEKGNYSFRVFNQLGRGGKTEKLLNQ